MISLFKKIKNRYNSKFSIIRDFLNLSLIILAVFFINNDNSLFFYLSPVSFYTFKDIPLILITGLLGSTGAATAVLISIIFKTITSGIFIYTSFIYLILILAVQLICSRGFLHNRSHAILSLIIISLILGNGWALMISIATNTFHIMFSTRYNVIFFLSALPECFISLFLLRQAHKYASLDFKRMFWGFSNYFYENGTPRIDHTKLSKISHKLTALIMFSMILIVSTAVLSIHYLMPALFSASQELNSDSTPSAEIFLQEEDIDLHDVTLGKYKNSQDKMKQRIHNETFAFDFRLTLMLLTPSICIGILMDYFIKRRFTRPIVEMSEAMNHLEDMDEEKLIKSVQLLCDLNISTHDELEDLRHSIEKMLYATVDYINVVRNEEKLFHELRVAQEANTAKTSFLSRMSHEIRTPINAILGMDEMILREYDEPQLKEYAVNIQNSGRTLLSLVNDILDFSKIEAGKMEIIPVEYDLSSVINDLVNMTSIKAEQKSLQLIINVDPDIPYILFGDDIRIRQCVLNIMTNAIKYTEKGSVTLGVSYKRKEDSVIVLKFTITDTGIGIKEEDLQKLYSPFERIEETRNRTIEGTGLGMSIVKMLLSLMNTQLNVNSVYGKGSEFSFEIEQKIVKDVPIGNFTVSYKKSIEAKNKYKVLFKAPTARILVVDDTVMNLTVAKGLLKQTMICVDTVENGFDALAQVKEIKYDCIFIDHRMPKMDGIETLQKMHEMADNINKDTPCIALTANAISGARENYLKAGFDDYLSKPIDSAKLEELLCSLLPPSKVNKAGTKEYDELDSSTAVSETKSDSTILMDQLRALHGIDLKAAMDNCGSAELLKELVIQFYETIDEKSSLIENYESSEDWKNYTIYVHALKSSARLIGAMKLSLMAKALEEAGNNLDISAIRADTPELLSLYRSYKSKLSAISESESAADSELPPIDAGLYDEMISTLKEFIEAFDYDSAESVINELSKYKLSEKDTEKFNSFCKAFKNIEHDKMLEILSS